MKKEIIFKTTLIFVLLVLSIFGLRINGKSNEEIVEKYKESDAFQQEVAFFILYNMKATDENIEFIQFSDEVSEEIREQVLADLNYYMNYANHYFSSRTFSFSFSNLDTGDAVYSGNYSEEVAVDRSVYEYNASTMMDEFKWFMEEQIWEVVDDWVARSSVSVAIPDDYYLTLQVNDYLLLTQMLSWEDYTLLPCIYLLVGSLFVGLFILFYPLRIEENTAPFSYLKKWKGEFSTILLLLGTALLGFGSIVYSGFFLGNFIDGLFMNQFGLPAEFSDLLFILIWFLTFFIVACDFYYLKHILCNGMIRYVKEDTWIGTICYMLKRAGKDLLFWDLSREQIFKILVFIALHVLVIITCWEIGVVGIVLYAVGMLLVAKWYIGRIQDDYTELLIETQELAKGNFDDSVCMDVGMFTSLQKELNSLRGGFERAVDEKIKSEKLKTELISHVSHDLKTPLTCIKNYVELLQEEDVTKEKQEEYIGILNQSVDRLSAMIEDLFDVSKVNSGDVKLELTKLNLVALIEQAQAECEDLLESKNLSVITKISNRNIMAVLDSNKTYRIFENIFTNIGKYAMPNTRVYIKVDENDDQVFVEIKNVSEAQMDFEAGEIMERFARGDQSRHESGSGLGLAIIKSFVEVQQGSFEVLIDADLFINRITFCKQKLEES